MSVIAALIFDLDGVLVNTVNLHFRAWAHLAERHGIAFAEDDMPRIRGRQRRDCLLDLFGERSLTEAEIATYLETKDHYYLDLVRQSKPANLLAPGAEALVDTARARNLKLGVASSSANAITVLRYVGLYDMVEVVADGTTVAHSKPAPDIFIWTAGALGVSPIRCLAFEDSHAGVAAAHQAGMFVVGIGAQLIDQAHLMLPSFEVMTLENILAAADEYAARQPEYTV